MARCRPRLGWTVRSFHAHLRIRMQPMRSSFRSPAEVVRYRSHRSARLAMRRICGAWSARRRSGWPAAAGTKPTSRRTATRSATWPMRQSGRGQARRQLRRRQLPPLRRRRRRPGPASRRTERRLTGDAVASCAGSSTVWPDRDNVAAYINGVDSMMRASRMDPARRC